MRVGFTLTSAFYISEAQRTRLRLYSSLNLFGVFLKFVLSSNNYLGVVFDTHRTRVAHTDDVCKQVTGRVSLLGWIRNF